MCSTIKDDHRDHRDRYDDLLDRLGVRHLAAVIAAVVLAVGGVAQLLVTLALDMHGTQLWGLGLACLLGSGGMWIYADTTTTASIGWAEQAHTARQAKIQMDRIEDRQSVILDGLERAQEISTQLQVIQQHVERLAGKVADLVQDDLSKRRRSG